MKKSIIIFLFFPHFIIVKTFAKNIDSTASAKQCFQNTKAEIDSMLSGKIPLNYERAVFLTENAYWGNKYSYESFEGMLDFQTLIIKSLSNVNNHEDSLNFKTTIDKTAAEKKLLYQKALDNWAIYTYLTDTTKLYSKKENFSFFNLPVKYSYNDPFGAANWKNTQVLSLLDASNKTGNCYAMACLFKIFSERLNSGANIATAPGHVFIMHADDHGTEYNIELPSHSFPGVGSIMTLTYTPAEAVEKGIAMRQLDLKQSINLCLIYLAKGYEKLFGNNDGFMFECAETALQNDSLSLNAMILKAEVFESAIIKQRKKLQDLNKDSLFLQYQNLLGLIIKKGYRQMPEEMERIIMSQLKHDNLAYIRHDYTPQPFKDIHVKEPRYATLSGGLFDEEAKLNKVENIGRTIFDTEQMKIIGFSQKDTVNTNEKIDAAVFAWGVDPLTKKYPELTPYQFASNRPIDGIDLDGLEHFYSADGILIGTIGTSTEIRVIDENKISVSLAKSYIKWANDNNYTSTQAAPYTAKYSQSLNDYAQNVDDVLGDATPETWGVHGNCYDAAKAQMDNAKQPVKPEEDAIQTDVDNSKQPTWEQLTENKIGGLIYIMTQLKKGKPVMVGNKVTINGSVYPPERNLNVLTTHFVVISSMTKTSLGFTLGYWDNAMTSSKVRDDNNNNYSVDTSSGQIKDDSFVAGGIVDSYECTEVEKNQ